VNYVDLGSAHNDTILLLHGGGLSWWNYREAARFLKNEYHVLLPILDGHAGSDRPFTTIEENATVTQTIYGGSFPVSQHSDGRLGRLICLRHYCIVDHFRL